MDSPPTRVCKACSKAKPTSSFAPIRGGSYRERTCYACKDARAQAHNPERIRRKAALKRQRNPASACLKDCRASDKKKGLEGNDLDLDFVKNLISRGCSYCGADKTCMRITLDRIDNAVAHTKVNVTPACLRCNYIRGSMPHVAWLCIVPKIKEAYQKGLFGAWRSTPFNRQHNF